MKTLKLLLLAIGCATLYAMPASCARYASIVMDAHSGRILHEAHADRRVYPASLTKMMTLYLLFEAIETGRISARHMMLVSKKASKQMPSKIGLKPGSRFKAQDAILALMTKSANDVAVVVAEALGGSEERFAHLMTAKARKLGMRNTFFRNASGVPNKHQLTTARDMAILSQSLFHHFPRYYRYFKTKTFVYRGQPYKNHNKLLWYVPGVDGIKTGFTNASGHNLAASAVRKGRRLIAVVIGGETRRWRDRHTKDLLEKTFAKLENMRHLTPIPTTPPRLWFAPAPLGRLHGGPPIPSPLPSMKQQVSYQKTRMVPSIKGGEASTEDLWSIQVGAYRSARTAYKSASRALSLVAQPHESKVSIRTTMGRRGKIHRARIVDLTKAQATMACQKLRTENLSCLLIAP